MPPSLPIVLGARLLAALLCCAPAQAETASLLASWYGARHEGRATASGCPFRAAGLTAASPDLPLGTVLEVSRAGRAVRVVVNDRGPYAPGRRLDLARGAAARLDMLRLGVARVSVVVVGAVALRC